MGDRVDMRQSTLEKTSTIGVALLFAPLLAGLALGAEAAGSSADSQPVATEQVARLDYGMPAAVGTADNPYSVAPTADAARRLLSVTSETFGGTALVELVGDGAFGYSAFQLADPARFVLDLPGVVKTTDQASLAVGHDIVSLVRVGQYRGEPEPVSRIVFDLSSPAVPHIEPTPVGLTVSFDAASVAATPSLVRAPDPRAGATRALGLGMGALLVLFAHAGADPARLGPPLSTILSFQLAPALVACPLAIVLVEIALRARGRRANDR